MATGITSFEVVRNQTAKETARVIHDRWFPYYSTPLLFVSDPHPGFASEVMDEFRELFGMKPAELAAPREKSKTGTVESRHNLLARVLGNGFAKGDIKDAIDLQTYCQEAKAEHDFETKGEVSPFECAVGQRPRTARCMSLCPEPDECNAEPMNPGHAKDADKPKLNGKPTAREKRLEKLRKVRFEKAEEARDKEIHHCGHLHLKADEMTDEKFLAWMRESKKPSSRARAAEDRDIDIEKLTEEDIQHQLSMMSPAEIAQLIEAETMRKVQLEGFRRDRRSRDSLMSRLRKQSKAPQAYNCDIKEGKEVSHKGKLFTVTDTTGSDGVTITAKIKPSRGEGPEAWVVATELRPSATPRPVRNISHREVEEDDFVIWQGKERMEGGIVHTHADDMKHVVVHEYEGTEDTASVWLPMWKKQGRLPVRKGRCPKGMTPMIREVNVSDIEVVGELTDTFRLTQNTLNELDAKGFNNK